MDQTFPMDQLQAIIEALPDPVFILTESGRYANIVGGSSTTLYHDGSSLIGKYLADVLDEQKTAWFLEQIKRALNQQQLITVEYGLGALDVNGLEDEEGPEGILWFEGRVQPLNSLCDGERAVVWVARNITKRYQLEAKLRHLTETDELTRLFNRRKILSELEYRFREFKRYMSATSFLIIDFDHFKHINDRFGHLMGDEVIKKVVQLCQQELREADQFARLGGEEFAVLMPNTELVEAMALAERLRKAVQQSPFNFLPEPWPITISIGISQFKAGDEFKEKVIARADKALYQAKEEGRNCVKVLARLG